HVGGAGALVAGGVGRGAGNRVGAVTGDGDRRCVGGVDRHRFTVERAAQRRRVGIIDGDDRGGGGRPPAVAAGGLLGDRDPGRRGVEVHRGGGGRLVARRILGHAAHEMVAVDGEL